MREADFPSEGDTERRQGRAPATCEEDRCQLRRQGLLCPGAGIGHPISLARMSPGSLQLSVRLQYRCSSKDSEEREIRGKRSIPFLQRPRGMAAWVGSQDADSETAIWREGGFLGWPCRTTAVKEAALGRRYIVLRVVTMEALADPMGASGPDGSKNCPK